MGCQKPLRAPAVRVLGGEDTSEPPVGNNKCWIPLENGATNPFFAAQEGKGAADIPLGLDAALTPNIFHAKAAETSC